MTIERCQRCVGSHVCENQVVTECLPVSCFGDITNPQLKVVTVGLNPALNEYYFNGIPRDRSQRLALLADYNVTARIDLRDADVADAQRRRDGYFHDGERNWHPYFERMESVVNRVDPDWSYVLGTVCHLDLVACATKDRWGNITPKTQALLVDNCREYFLDSLSKLASGTVLLCDGPRATREIKNLGLPVEHQPAELINIRETGGGDCGWIGKLILGGKEFPFRGWSSHVTQLTAVWRFDLAFWLRETFAKR
jgi:hypothetical protein